MPEFKTHVFDQAEKLEAWLNELRRGGYFVRIQSIVALSGYENPDLIEKNII